MVLKEPLSMQKMLIEEGEEWCFNEGCLSIYQMFVRTFTEIQKITLSIGRRFCSKKQN
jgi:hypothetical protein